MDAVGDGSTRSPVTPSRLSPPYAERFFFACPLPITDPEEAKARMDFVVCLFPCDFSLTLDSSPALEQRFG